MDKQAFMRGLATAAKNVGQGVGAVNRFAQSPMAGRMAGAAGNMATSAAQTVGGMMRPATTQSTVARTGSGPQYPLGNAFSAATQTARGLVGAVPPPKPKAVQPVQRPLQLNKINPNLQRPMAGPGGPQPQLNKINPNPAARAIQTMNNPGQTQTPVAGGRTTTLPKSTSAPYNMGTLNTAWKR